jgi:hypothetical protein
VHDDDPVPAVEDFFDCEELTEMAVAAIVTGEAGAIGCDWLKSTPDVSIAGTSAELDRLDALTEELLKAADVSDPGTDCKVKTVLGPRQRPCRTCGNGSFRQGEGLSRTPPPTPKTTCVGRLMVSLATPSCGRWCGRLQSPPR